LDLLRDVSIERFSYPLLLRNVSILCLIIGEIQKIAKNVSLLFCCMLIETYFLSLFSYIAGNDGFFMSLALSNKI